MPASDAVAVMITVQ